MKKESKFFLEILDMMNKPTEFFKKDLSIVRGLVYFLLGNLVFTSMTQTLVYYGIIPAVLETEFFLSIIINFFSIVAGFALISAALIAVNTVIGGKNHFQLLITLLYSVSPLLLIVWIPFIFMQFIVLLWSLAMIMIGVHDKERFSYRRSIIYPVLFLALVFVLTYVSRNYILLGWLK